jgi:hypothetical protein
VRARDVHGLEIDFVDQESPLCSTPALATIWPDVPAMKLWPQNFNTVAADGRFVADAIRHAT